MWLWFWSWLFWQLHREAGRPVFTVSNGFITLSPGCLVGSSALEHGARIRMVRVEEATIGVDTPDDLERVRRALSP